MRIIAGQHRGRRIAAPAGRGTRPMLDRVREALFSTLGGRLEGAEVLDLFAGSGSLGLEALSRGATRARMVERSKGALEPLRRNVEQLDLAERADVVRGDALDPALWSSAWGGDVERWDLVFLDPPYEMAERSGPRAVLLARMRELADRFLAEDGLIVLHAPPGALEEADLASHWRTDVRTYGRSALWYLQPRAGDSPEDGGEA